MVWDKIILEFQKKPRDVRNLSNKRKRRMVLCMGRSWKFVCVHKQVMYAFQQD